MSKESVLELSKKIEDSVILEESIIKEKNPGDVYKQNLPEGITIEVVQKVNDYDAEFIAAGAHAYGKIAIEAMASDKNLNQVTGELKTVGKNKASYSIERSKEYVNHLQGGEKTVKYGVLNTSYEIKAGKNSGQLKAVKNELAELALSKLK